MLNYIDVKIDSIAVHHVDRKDGDIGLKLSNDLLDHPDEILHEHLCQYLFGSFKEPNFFSFKLVDGDYDQNPMFRWTKDILDEEKDLLEISKEYAKFLFNNSEHPNINGGDLFVFYFHDMLVDDELVSGVGLCKSENKNTFLQVDHVSEKHRIKFDKGIAINKVDKACLIFNTDVGDGYKILAADNVNRAQATFWLDQFLMVEPRIDAYQNTKQYIEMTKSFIKDRMQPTYETDKMDEVDVMNRSQSYFTVTDNFEEEKYANDVFPQQEVARDFLDYRRDYESEKGVQVDDQFEVSPQAVHKQSKFFKSVLKLDKNFHIYIHGNRDMIERGTDADGRKYYKVFFQEER